MKLVILGNLTKLVQSVTNIFVYSNILVTDIYLEIRLHQFFVHKYIWTSIHVKLVDSGISGNSVEFNNFGASGESGSSDDSDKSFN